MSGLRLISFDVGGTLVDHSFADLVWNTGIPRLYARKKGILLEEASRLVTEEYDAVGKDDSRWYVLQYWFDLFDLDGSPGELLESFKREVRIYPEVPAVLGNLKRRYDLIVVSNAPTDILTYEIEALRHHFGHVFSSISDFNQIRKTPDMYARICTAMHMRPEQVLHIGDHKKNDFEAAREAGMQALYLDRSKREENEFTLPDLKRLEAILLSIGDC